MDETDLQKLRQATGGLLYPSETDAPFDVFHWPATGGDAKAALAANAGGDLAHMDEVSIKDFFAELAESEDADKFDQLRRTIEEIIGQPRVFRFGKPEVQIHIIGRSKSGDWIGLHTISVETG